MKLRFWNNEDEDYSQPYVDATDFAEAALWDESESVDVIENLRELEEISGEGTRVTGYCREAEQIINQWRLGKN
jgi:hypothetical protein